MNILAIETTGPVASAAVIDDDGCVCEVVGEGRLTHLEKLIPLVDKALEDCGKTLNDIEGIAVSRGPGSFTGIRIGVATAKALAQVLGLEVAEVPSLYAAALGAARFEGIICVVLDARRSQVYAAAYECRWGELTEILPEKAYDIREVADAVKNKGPVYFLGDGIFIDEIRSVLENEVGGEAFFAHEETRVQRADSAAVVGSEIFAAGKAVSYSEAKPEYLRISEAERKLLEKRERS